MIFLCPHLTKARFPAGLFAASFQVFLTTCTIGRWKEMSPENGSNIHHCDGLSPSVQKLPDLRDVAEEKGWTTKLLCSHQQCNPWSQVDFTNTADSQDYHYQEIKRRGVNQTGLLILNYMLKINLTNLSWILNLCGRYCKESGHQQQNEKVFETGLQLSLSDLFAADLPFLNKTFFFSRWVKSGVWVDFE